MASPGRIQRLTHQACCVRVYSSDSFVLPLPPGHRFPMARYRLLRERVESLDGIHWSLAEPVSRERLERVHCPHYVARVLRGQLDKLEQRRLGFPWSEALVERSLRSVGATVSAALWAWDRGEVAVNLAGGTHHAFADRGEGFCLFNDCVVAARVLQQERAARQLVVIDCDVHQGNGTAALCTGDDGIFTLSLHGANNYPFHKEVSDCDVELPDGCDDERYLLLLDWALARLPRPQLAFYLAGADPYVKDRLGRLSLSRQGLRARDRRVFQFCRSQGCALVITMAGGYAEPIEDTADIQAATVAEALACWKNGPALGQGADCTEGIS
jgi:acetoin utilization deacetylase AcuC-like enzyme